MTRSFLVLLALPIASSLASTDQCPNLKGTFLCPGVAGGANETRMSIQQVNGARWVTYYYTWYESGEPAVESYFVANDQGRRQDDNWSNIGKCIDGFLFVAPYGEPRQETRYVHLNAQGDYEAIRHADRKIDSLCKRIR